MDIRHIRYLVCAIEGKSLSAAAKHLFVTVQAVSKAISELENELDTQLLVRGNQGVTPTAAGEALYQRAKNVLSSFDALADFTMGFPARKSTNHLSICLCSPHLNNEVSALGNLARLIGSRLGIKVSIITGTSRQCLDALTSDTVDAVATVGEYASPETDCLAIGTLPVGVVVAQGHPLAHRPNVHTRDLAPYPVLRSEHFDTSNRSILETQRACGLQSPVITYHDGLDLDDFLQRQHGFVFAVHMPSLTLSLPCTTSIPLAPGPGANIPLCLVTRKAHKTPAYLDLESHVDDIFRGGGVF